jgi:hypothetical protein
MILLPFGFAVLDVLVVGCFVSGDYVCVCVCERERERGLKALVVTKLTAGQVVPWRKQGRRERRCYG